MNGAIITVTRLAKGEPPPFAGLPVSAHLVAPPTNFTVLEGGMQSGKTSVGMVVDLPNGELLIVEWSLAVLNMAVHACLAFAEEWERNL